MPVWIEYGNKREKVYIKNHGISIIDQAVVYGIF